MLDFFLPTQISWIFAVILVVLIVRFLQKLHFQRSLMKGLPGPPHSYIWGSLPAMASVVAEQPKYASGQTIALPLQQKYQLDDYFYVDPWPLESPTMMILNVDMMNEFFVKQSLPKHPNVDAFMKPLGGPGNLVSAEGAEWKKWRSSFDPGFSSQHLMTLVPVIVDECDIFCDILDQHARNNDLFRMEQATTKLTVDIIGRVVLDLSFNAQRGPNELVDTLIEQIRWHPVGARFKPIETIDIRRPIVQAYNTWKMNRYLRRCLAERFSTRIDRGKTKHIIDLALESYLREVKGTSGDFDGPKTLDPDFERAAINNFKTFLFAGHDTTSGTVCYAYYYLSKNPDALAEIHREHDEIFGPDTSGVAEQLRDSPHLLNRLEYTTAVIKEVLRLQPPGTGVRIGKKGFFLRDPKTNKPLPTENFMLWPVTSGIGRSAIYWGPDPHAFRPERHLESTPGSNNNTRDAWVPFSKGIRQCIGQGLAMLEIKVVLAMTLRRFDFTPAYHELDALRGDGSGYPNDTTGVQTQFGEEAYQVTLGSAKPREGMPCRVRRRQG